MRVIAGSARRLLLKTIEGMDTRPTTDRIKEYLSRTHLEEGALVLNCDVIAGLKKLEGRNPRFDIIFMDPPYNHEFENRVLEYLSSSPMVTEDTLIIIEASKETDFDWLSDAGFHMIKEKVYKTNKHIFAGKGA